MSDYTNTYGGAAKDAANDIILGADVDTQLDNIATMSGTKADKVSGATVDSIAKLDANGNIVDSGKDIDDLSITTVTTSGDIAAGTNITVGGTVDGRDVAADGAILDALPVTYHGRVSATSGSGTVLGPSGFTYNWSSAGNCTITHNLGTANYTPLLSAKKTTAPDSYINENTPSANTLTIYTADVSLPASGHSRGFNFIIMMD